MDFNALIQGLNSTEKNDLYNFLKMELGIIPKLETVKSEINTEQEILCPHCGSTDIYGHGSYKKRKRYKCKACVKTFNDFTGTAVSGIKKIDEFQQFLEQAVNKLPIRKAAKKLNVSTKTIFDWRHKILSALSSANGESFQGIVECDDKQVDICEKGNRKLTRKSYKRSSDRKKKRGVSNDKVSLMVATDRKGNSSMKIAKIGRIDTKSLEVSIGNIISEDNVLCSDSHPTIVLWAKNRNLKHHTFIATKQHVKNKCYHVQHVNSLDNKYERWVKRFYGVATKYLPQYLNWFVFLEKLKKSINPTFDFAKQIIVNTNAIISFRKIEEVYDNLLNPQFSNT